MSDQTTTETFSTYRQGLVRCRAGCNGGPDNTGHPPVVLPEADQTVPPLWLTHRHFSAEPPAYSFVPRLVTYHLARPGLPRKQELAVLFVDIADATRAVLRQPPEIALAVIQRFMGVVTDITLAHCGDVKDYEGDGALLYFRSLVDATRAAFAIRAALEAEAAKAPDPLPPRARLSLNVGEVIIGEIGSSARRSIALIGPSVSLAARLLKHVSPGGIIAPEAAVRRLQEEAPDLGRWFTVWGECLTLKGFEDECITAYHVPGSSVPGRGDETVTQISTACHGGETLV